MSTTAQQDRDFTDALFPNSLLELAVDWIADNMNPDDVFSDKVLREWATANGFVEDEPK